MNAVSRDTGAVERVTSWLEERGVEVLTVDRRIIAAVAQAGFEREFLSLLSRAEAVMTAPVTAPVIPDAVRRRRVVEAMRQPAAGRHAAQEPETVRDAYDPARTPGGVR
ncbi:hypothetical protein GCM10027294_43450 [Marinactinospora endophytica]